MQKLNYFETLISDNQLDKALCGLNEMEITEKKEQIAVELLKCRIYQKQQKWGELINHSSHVLEIDPLNMEAKAAIEVANNILSFYTKDLLNP